MAEPTISDETVDAFIAAEDAYMDAAGGVVDDRAAVRAGLVAAYPHLVVLAEDERHELQAYRDGVGQLACDKPSPGSPVITCRGRNDEDDPTYYQSTHQGVPVWICADCVRLSVSAVAPPACPGCGSEDSCSEALEGEAMHCKALVGGDACELAGTVACFCDAEVISGGR